MSERTLPRPVVLVVLVLLLAGAASLGLERAGLYACGCYPDCWCKRPGLNLFRWLVPRFHRGPWSAEDKARHFGS